MKPLPSGTATASLPPVPSAPQNAPPQTPQNQNATLPVQTPSSYTTTTAQASPPKPAPSKPLKALPTVRDHTTDILAPSGDEYLVREIDEAGEKKVLPNGQLLGGRQYKCRTFCVPNRGDKLFMLATECARVLGYRDSYLLFNKNRSLYKIIANQAEKDDLVAQEILPFSYRSRQIAIVTARSMFRQFGSRMIVNGRRVRDDYWESKARKQGFTEDDPAGEKRPGASRARAAAEASHAASLMAAPHGEIVYSTSQFGPQPPLVPPGMLGGPATTRPSMITLGPDYSDTRSRDYSSILKNGPRQEITGPPYQDRIQPTPLTELHAQAHHAAEFNRTLNQQREMRADYMNSIWRRPHEQPVPPALPAPVSAPDPVVPPAVPPSRTSAATHTSSLQPPAILPNQSPQLMMTAAPYSQSIHAPNPVASQGSLRAGMAHHRSVPQATFQQAARGPTHHSSATGSTTTASLAPAPAPAQPNYTYSQSAAAAPNQMWPPAPQTPQHGAPGAGPAPGAPSPYSAYTTAPAQPHQSTPGNAGGPGTPQLRHGSAPSAAAPAPGSNPAPTGAPAPGPSPLAPYSGLPGMPGQGYGPVYGAEQTPRGYMHHQTWNTGPGQGQGQQNQQQGQQQPGQQGQGQGQQTQPQPAAVAAGGWWGGQGQ